MEVLNELFNRWHRNNGDEEIYILNRRTNDNLKKERKSQICFDGKLVMSYMGTANSSFPLLEWLQQTTPLHYLEVILALKSRISPM